MCVEMLARLFDLGDWPEPPVAQLVADVARTKRMEGRISFGRGRDLHPLGKLGCKMRLENGNLARLFHAFGLCCNPLRSGRLCCRPFWRRRQLREHVLSPDLDAECGHVLESEPWAAKNPHRLFCRARAPPRRFTPGA